MESITTVHPYPKNADVVRLRAGGWTPTQIAEAVGATERQVWRWAAGESRPLKVYARALAALTVPRESALVLAPV